MSRVCAFFRCPRGGGVFLHCVCLGVTQAYGCRRGGASLGTNCIYVGSLTLCICAFAWLLDAHICLRVEQSREPTPLPFCGMLSYQQQANREIYLCRAAHRYTQQARTHTHRRRATVLSWVLAQTHKHLYQIDSGAFDGARINRSAGRINMCRYNVIISNTLYSGGHIICAADRDTTHSRERVSGGQQQDNRFSRADCL